MPNAVALVWDLAAKDSASPAFLRVAGAADKAAAATTRAQRGIEGASARMATVGAKLTKGLTLPLLGIGAVSVAQAAKWQKAMTLIQTAGGETAAKTKVLSSGLQKIAKDTGTSLDQLGEGIYTIAKAGAQKWSAVDQLKVMKAAAQGAKAENVDLATATDALSTVMLDYHTKASGAVGVENQLIRASGLAKTTFQEFSSSLSNVVPIAAASGLSFKEVGGAIATMTQHGVSAKQATDNLRNLIFNLTGQNNVASGAMQQLGINTVDLAKNLGKRGLSGTLAIVDRALKTHTHDGMVTIDVHKAAALSTKSLNTEMGTFSGTLKSQSQQLLSGKVGIKDYTTYAKSLGGTAGASALQFLSLYKNSQGFSDQLKSGNGTITTTTKQYQKMLGGMTGAAVAMQIGGKYAKENARNVREVGKAALAAGSDVLGWNKTQDTLAVKMDKAKASLQVLAVEIGTALIPAVSKIVDWVSKAVHWFSNLSGTQKKVLAWSAGILLALGPLMSLGGKLASVGAGIARFSTFVGSRIGGLAGAMEQRSGIISKSMSRMGAAIGGAGIGLAVGTLTQNASTATKAIGVLGSAAAGAALGFSAGGPWGAAIGGIAGGLTALVSSWGGEGDAAKKAAAEAHAAIMQQKQDTNDLLDALKSVNGQYNKNYKDSVVSKLQSKGALSIAAEEGVSGKDVTNATLGDQKAMARVQAKLQWIIGGGLKNTYDKSGNLVSSQATSTQKQIDDAEKLYTILYKTGLSAKGAETAYEQFIGAEGHALVSTKRLASGLSGTKKGFAGLKGEFAGSGRDLRQYTAYGQRNTNVIRENLGYLNKQAKAQLAHGKTVSQVSQWYQQNTKSLGDNLVKMGFERGAVNNLINTYNKTPKSVTTEMRTATAKAHSNIHTLQSAINAVKQGKVPGLSANTAAGRRYVKSLQTLINQIKQGKVPSVDVSTAVAQAKLKALLAAIPSGTFHFNAVADYKAQLAGRASGGGLPEGVSAVGERGPELAMKRGSHVEIVANGPSRGIAARLGAMGIRVPGFASGTTGYSAIAGLLKALGATRAGIAGFLGNTKIESGGSTTAHNFGENAWGYQQWEGGRLTALKNLAQRMHVSYKSQAAQLAMIKQELTHGYKSTLTDLRHATSSKSAAAYVDAHYERSSGSARGARESAAAAFYRSAISKGAGGKYSVSGIEYSTATAAHNAATRKREAVDKAASKLLEVARNAKSTYSQLSSAAGSLKNAAKTTLAGQTRLLAYAKRRDALVGKISAAQDKLKAAQSAYRDAYYSNVASVGQVDYTSLGAPTQVYTDRATPKPSAATFIAGFQGVVAKSKTFAAVLKKLVQEGMPRGIVTQLAAAGPDALLQAQALAASTPKQLAQIQSLYKQQGVNQAAGGKTIADAYYKAGVDSAQGIVNGLLSQQTALNKAITKLANSMVYTLKHKLGIHSPSTVMRWHGQMSGEGYALGLEDKFGRIEQASSKMTGSPRAAGTPAGRNVTINGGLHVHEAYDAVATMNTVQRRLQQLGA